MSGKGTKVIKCAKFEPQIFRRNLCKNCFKTDPEHKEDYEAPKADPPKPKTPKEPPKTEAKQSAEPEIKQPQETRAQQKGGTTLVENGGKTDKKQGKKTDGGKLTGDKTTENNKSKAKASSDPPQSPPTIKQPIKLKEPGASYSSGNKKSDSGNISSKSSADSSKPARDDAHGDTQASSGATGSTKITQDPAPSTVEAGENGAHSTATSKSAVEASAEPDTQQRSNPVASLVVQQTSVENKAAPAISSPGTEAHLDSCTDGVQITPEAKQISTRLVPVVTTSSRPDNCSSGGGDPALSPSSHTPDLGEPFQGHDENSYQIGESPGSSGSSSRRRRSRGNSDHLVQDPGTGVTIQYPGQTEIVLDQPTSPQPQAALIIIPSTDKPRSPSEYQQDPLVVYQQQQQQQQQQDQQDLSHTSVITAHKPDLSGSVSQQTLAAISGSSLYYTPDQQQQQQPQPRRQQLQPQQPHTRGQVIYNSSSGGDWYYNSNVVPTRSQTDEDVNLHASQNNKGAYNVRRRRKRPSVDESAWQAARERRMAGLDPAGLGRDEAMMEGTRMLIDSLREKVVILEARCEKIDREKNALGDLLSSKKEECINLEEDLNFRLGEYEDRCARLLHEKNRLLDRLKLPESERSSLGIQEHEINDLQLKLEEGDKRFSDLVDENVQLKQECRDLQLEMEEMHDQFRDDEALEFRELQKELEATAKNCRILQFKLRKSERRNEQIEADRLHYEEKIHQLESRYDTDDKLHIRELEEELKMAKEVSVRLHDELEMVEEKRLRYEEELDRMNDILTESECRRHALQKDMDTMNNELSKLREDVRRQNSGHTPLGSTSKQPGKDSTNVDLAQVMRDLSDSLEREADLKEQMKYVEEETRQQRKKLGDLEEENESLNYQVNKLSTAKSGKFLRKKAGEEKEVVTEREHEMRLEMELAEQEIKVLRRKLDDLMEDNELLLKQIRDIHNLVEGKSKKVDPKDDDRPYDEKIRDMAKDIEALKLKLIEKDQEAANLLRSSSAGRKLKKSRSLEESRSEVSPSRSPAREIQQDIRRQLDFVQQETCVLKEKILYLEKENEKLVKENQKMEIMAGRSGMPSITADDAAVQNIDLKERVQQLEAENTKLREQIKILDKRTSQLSKEILETRPKGDILDESNEANELRNRLREMEEELRKMRKKVTDLEEQNAKLTRDINKQKNDGKRPREWKKMERSSSDQLKDKVWDLEEEIKHLTTVVKNREEENTKTEAELDVYRDDIDKMLDAFKTREKELIEEIDNLGQRNEVLSNLLELVTNRADSTTKELERLREENGSQKSGSSTPSDLREVSTGSDDVFVSSPGVEQKKSKLKARIESLENLLAEERLKFQAVEKKLAMKDSPVTSLTDDGKLKEREKEILQQELAVSQKQLTAANDLVKTLKERLEKEQSEYEGAREDYEKVSKELATEKGRKKEDKPEADKKPATWRWEKTELEKELKEAKKKYDDLHAELKRQQFKWKLAGDDLARENKLKEKLEKKLQDVRDECDEVRTELDTTKGKFDEVQKSLAMKEKTWNKEKESLENDKKVSDQEIKMKDETIKSKDDIISNKDSLIKEKDKSLKERKEAVKKMEEQVKQKDTEIQLKEKSTKQRDDDLKDTKKKLKTLEQSVKEKESTLKRIDDDLRSRDERLKEKDEILEKINRKLVDKQNEVSDMDKTIRQAMIKLDDREVEVQKLKASLEKANEETTAMEEKLKTMKDDLAKQKKDYEKKMKVTEKNGTELSTLKKENKSLTTDLQEAKDKLKKEQDKYKKEKNKLDLELSQKTEKLKSLETNKGLKQSEVVKNISTEKETLITEKHKLTDDISKLKKDAKKNSKQWNSDKDELQSTIDEKSKLIDENEKTIKRLQKEIEALKKGQVSPSNGSKTIPIPVAHEVSSHRIPVIHASKDKKDKASEKSEVELKAKIEEQEILMEADKEGLRDLYEGRLSCVGEELSVAHDKISTLKSENDAQLDLLQSSRKTLADLRKRYDSSQENWESERKNLEKKVKEGEDGKKKLGDLQSSVDDLKDKVKVDERKAKDAEKKLTTERSVWNAEKASLENRLKQAEESGGGSSSQPATKVSEFRAKFDRFEKFGGTTKAAAGARKTSDGTKSPDVEKAIKDAQKSVKDLQSHLAELEKTREKDKKELTTRLDKEKVTWEKEKKKMGEQTAKLESRVREYTSQDKLLAELQCKLQEERAGWQTEKSHMNSELDTAKQRQLAEKAKVTELLAEVKKLKLMTSAIQDKGSEAVQEVLKKGPRRSRTPSEERPSYTKVKVVGPEEPDEVKRALDKMVDSQTQEHAPTSPECLRRKRQIPTPNLALEHISRLAEGLQSPVRVNERKKKPSAPAAFRRSLSTSEVEMKADQETFVHSLSASSYTPLAQSMPPPPSSERQSRSRHSRALPAQDGEYESSTVDRRSFRSSSKRNSMYASGTQSACTSRDSSPEKGQKGRSPYPAAPPSMIITPSHTPRRAPSAERTNFTNRDMARLYEKLNSIEADKTEAQALEKERGKGVRVLTKSMSMDSDEAPKKLNLSQKYPSTYDTRAKVPDEYNDAHKSETLLASIRLGELVITPGVEKQAKSYRSETSKEQRAASLSPKSARRKFYENYSYDPKDSDSWSSRYSRKESESDLESNDYDSHTIPKDRRLHKKTLTRGQSLDIDTSTDQAEGSTTDTEQDSGRSRREKYSLRRSAEKFIQSVKDKRKMFSKRSSSVDTTVRKSITNTGITAATTASPSSFDPPETPPKEKKKSLHRRSTSIDMTSLFTVSPRSTSLKSRNVSSSDSSHSPAASSADKKSSRPPRASSTSRDPQRSSARSTPTFTLPLLRPVKKKSDDGKNKSLAGNPNNSRSIPTLVVSDFSSPSLVPESSAVGRSVSFRRATSECPLAITELPLATKSDSPLASTGRSKLKAEGRNFNETRV